MHARGAATRPATARREEEHILNDRPLGLPDDEIVRRVCAGECELFEHLLQRYNRRLYRVARAVLRNDVDAEDVVQEAWLRAFANLGQLAEPSRFSAWIGRIALYEAWARARRDRRAGPGERESTTPPRAAVDPERTASNRESLRILEEAIDALPEKYRLALVLRGIEGLTAAEAARHLNVSRLTINTRFHRARALLRARLSESGLQSRAFDFLGSRCRWMRWRVMDRVAEMVRTLEAGQGGKGSRPCHLVPLPARVDPLVNARGRSSES